MCVFQLHWGWSREKMFPAFLMLMSHQSLSACVNYSVCVSVWVFVFCFFFFNKEKKMCIFLAMTET